LLSGRDSCCRNKTEVWLNNQGIEYDELFMRSEGNNEDDAIIKEKIYKEKIENKYNVMAVFDDRPKVRRMWLRNGLYVFSCDQNCYPVEF